MKVTKLQDRIIVSNPTDFNIRQTLECGQIFRYTIKDDTAEVYSLDKHAHIVICSDSIEIHTNDVEYFYHFFDFDRDYETIKTQLRKVNLSPEY